MSDRCPLGYLFSKIGKMSQNLSTAAVVIGALRVKLHSNVLLRQLVCRIHNFYSDTRLQFRVMGFALEFRVRSISSQPFERFSLNFIQMLLIVIQCAEFMTQLCRVKVKVTLQGHGIYPWLSCPLHISSTLWKNFIKLHPNVPLSEIMCQLQWRIQRASWGSLEPPLAWFLNILWKWNNFFMGYLRKMR